MKTAIEYTDQERAEIIYALKAVLLATAEFWDVLGRAEQTHEVEIEYSDNLIGMLAGDLKKPPSFHDLTDEDVWETFLEDVTVRE